MGLIENTAKRRDCLNAASFRRPSVTFYLLSGPNWSIKAILLRVALNVKKKRVQRVEAMNPDLILQEDLIDQ